MPISYAHLSDCAIANADQRYLAYHSVVCCCRRIAGIATGCLRTAADGSCSQLADASDAACATATQPGAERTDARRRWLLVP